MEKKRRGAPKDPLDRIEKAEFLNKSNICLDFDFHSKSLKLMNSPLLSPIGWQNLKQTKKAPDTPHHHLPTTQHDRDSDSTPGEPKTHKKATPNPTQTPTSERNTEKPTNTLQRATAHPHIPLCFEI